MDTILAAVIGFAAALIGGWMTTRAQRQNDREARMLDARVLAYNACSDALYEYARASQNRSKARLDALDEHEREPLRQDHYRANTRARSAIGQVAIVTGDHSLAEQLERARRAVSDFKKATNGKDLSRRWNSAREHIGKALDEARKDLAPRPRVRLFRRSSTL